jgi:hypothetical protein
MTEATRVPKTRNIDPCPSRRPADRGRAAPLQPGQAVFAPRLAQRRARVDEPAGLGAGGRGPGLPARPGRLGARPSRPGARARIARIGARSRSAACPGPSWQERARRAFRRRPHHVPDGPRQGPRIKALLTAMARDRLRASVARHAAEHRAHPGKLTLRDPRSRWGSCSAKGDLMFSFRLIMTPPEVLDYVAAHEVAHLVEMNHGPAFWDALPPALSHDGHPSPLAQGPRRRVSGLALRHGAEA